MNNPQIAALLRLQAYETWANDRALASLDTVPVDMRTRPSFTRAAQLLPHSTLARTIWLMRLRGVKHEIPKEWFPNWTTEETRRQMSTVDAQWREFLGSLTDADTERVITYHSSEGVRYESSVHDICTHVFHHSAYHRGQVARLVSESGGQRASTDYIIFTRVQK